MRPELFALLLLGACRCDAEREPVAASRTAAATPAPPLASKEYFRVDAAPEQPACRVGTPCEARLVLTALGDYHVNPEYPFKLVAQPTPGVTLLGTGTFAPDGKRGTLALPFRAAEAGMARIAGTFKLSVCNDENCQIEAPKIALELPVQAQPSETSTSGAPGTR